MDKCTHRAVRYVTFAACSLGMSDTESHEKKLTVMAQKSIYDPREEGGGGGGSGGGHEWKSLLKGLQRIFETFCDVFLRECVKSESQKRQVLKGYHQRWCLHRMTIFHCFSLHIKVTLALPSAQKVNPSKKITHRVFEVPYEAEMTGETISKVLMEKGTSLEVIHLMNEMHRVLCECLLNDTDFLDDLRDFDLIVHDSVATCPVLLAELLNIRRVEIEPVSPNAPFLFYHMVPMPVSYVPQSFPGYSDKMTFLQRVINLGAYIFGSRIFMALLADTMNGVKYKYNIKPERTFQKAVGDAELLIII